MPEIIDPYCFVKGCDNEVEPGGPRPALCNSCYFLLRDGPDKDTVGESFIHDLIRERDQYKWRSSNACLAMDGGNYLSVEDLIQIYFRYYELTKANASPEEPKPVDDGKFQAYTNGFWNGFDMGYEKAGKVSKE
jgi:hypothetical protein